MFKKIINIIRKVLGISCVYYVGNLDRLKEPLPKEEELKYPLTCMKTTFSGYFQLQKHHF